MRAAHRTPVTGLTIGIEREGQRVTSTGQLARRDLATAVPRPVRGLTRDFAETQLELVTPTMTSTNAALAALARIQHGVSSQLRPTELIWPLSMPPTLPRASEAIVIAKLSPQAFAYRQQLARRGGRRRQMISGLHVNVGFSAALLDQLFAQQAGPMNRREFQNQLYLHVAQNYLRYRWLLTYAFGASPTRWPRLLTHTGPAEPVRSIRNSPFGYTNLSRLQVSYCSVAAYVTDLKHLVATGQLGAEKAFYGQVSLRGGHAVTDLAATGIDYLELRNFDLNPFDPLGVDQVQLDFLHGFILLMLSLPAPQNVAAAIHYGEQLNRQVALERPTAETAQLAEGRWLLAQFDQLVVQLGVPAFQTASWVVRSRLAHPEQTPAARWLRDCQHQPTKLALALARHHARVRF
ncbi:glutamate--cysteine ligase [Lactiplantibacillus plajomi]